MRLQGDTELVKNLIESDTTEFWTSSKVKRKLTDIKNIGKNRICKIMRSLGYRYKSNSVSFSQLRKQKRDLKEFAILQALSTFVLKGISKEIMLINVDEFKCVLDQVPLKAWRHKAEKDLKVRDRQRDLVITCAVACTAYRVVGLQFFTRELSASDFFSIPLGHASPRQGKRFRCCCQDCA